MPHTTQQGNMLDTTTLELKAEHRPFSRTQTFIHYSLLAQLLNYGQENNYSIISWSSYVEIFIIVMY